MNTEIPKIELFVSDVSLEFPPAARMRETFSVEPEKMLKWWDGDWGHDWDDSHSGPGADEYGNPVTPDVIDIKDIRLRDERFGGLVFIPSTRRVLKANKVGIEIVKALQSGHVDNSMFSSEHIEVVKNILLNESVRV